MMSDEKTSDERMSYERMSYKWILGEIPIRKGYVVSVACCYIILKCVFTDLGEKLTTRNVQEK